MIKYCHELTKEEYEKLGDGKKSGLTFAEFAELYPQPIWCSYPDATFGTMGCWSLLDFDNGHSMVTGEKYCKGCDCYIPKLKRIK